MFSPTINKSYKSPSKATKKLKDSFQEEMQDKLKTLSKWDQLYFMGITK